MTKFAFAHYFTPYPRSLDNKNPKALGGTGDYYDNGYLNPTGENGAHAAYGGLLRDRPIPRAPLTGDWELQDMQWEISTAKTGSLDGFTVDLLEIDSSSGANFNGIGYHARRVKKLCQAADADGSFKIVLMPDMSAWSGQTAANVAATVAQLARTYKSVMRLDDGRVVVAPFYPETKQAAWWLDFVTIMKSSYGLPVALVPCFLNYEGNVAGFKAALGTSLYGAANWGNRTPATNALVTNTNRIKDAHSRGLIWMQPVSFQDVRPNQRVYAEACNTQNLRLTWQAAINGDSDWVQCTTWNDFSEGTQFCPSVDHGYVITEQNGFYARWFKTGAQPTIVNDQIILTYRKQFFSDAPTFPETSLMKSWQSQPPQDTVEVLVKLAKPGTINIVSGTITKAFQAPAGISVFSMPLQPGAQGASLVRNGVRLASCPGTVMVTHTPYVQDMGYVAASRTHRN